MNVVNLENSEGKKSITGVHILLAPCRLGE